MTGSSQPWTVIFAKELMSYEKAKVILILGKKLFSHKVNCGRKGKEIGLLRQIIKPRRS